MIIEIISPDSDIVNINFGTATWYRAQQVVSKPSYDTIRILAASDDSTSCRRWGMNGDGTINLYKPSIIKKYG